MAKTLSRSSWTRAVSTGKMVIDSSQLTLISLVGGFAEVGGSVLAVPGIAEKGYIDVMVTVSTAGGHSSVPPPHTVGSSFCSLVRDLIVLHRVLAFSPVSSSSSKPIRSNLSSTVALLFTATCNVWDSMPRNSQHTCAHLSRHLFILTGPCANWRRN